MTGGTKKHATHHTMRRTPSLCCSPRSHREEACHQVGGWKKSVTKRHQFKTRFSLFKQIEIWNY